MFHANVCITIPSNIRWRREIVFATSGKNPMVWLEWRTKSVEARDKAGKGSGEGAR